MFASAFWSFIEFGVHLLFLFNILKCVVMIAYFVYTAPTTKALRAVTVMVFYSLKIYEVKILIGGIWGIREPTEPYLT